MFWDKDHAKENYKSRQDFPVLIVGKSQALLLKLSNFARILIRVKEFHNKKLEMYQHKYRFVRVAEFRRKESS